MKIKILAKSHNWSLVWHVFCFTGETGNSRNGTFPNKPNSVDYDTFLEGPHAKSFEGKFGCRNINRSIVEGRNNQDFLHHSSLFAESTIPDMNLHNPYST